MEIIGKQGRKVPLLIPPDAKQALELLVTKRDDAGVHADNLFVFAKVSVCTADNYVNYINSPMLLLFLLNDSLETNIISECIWQPPPNFQDW